MLIDIYLIHHPPSSSSSLVKDWIQSDSQTVINQIPTQNQFRLQMEMSFLCRLTLTRQQLTVEQEALLNKLLCCIRKSFDRQRSRQQTDTYRIDNCLLWQTLTNVIIILLNNIFIDHWYLAIETSRESEFLVFIGLLCYRNVFIQTLLFNRKCS